MEALATKYRPRVFNDVVCQDNVKRVLGNQLQTREFKQAYLFCGSAGTGKTTSARIFANEVNQGKGKPIEIDGASNNGVDNVRDIIDNCKMKSLDSEYKVYIIDEVHMLSIGAFNALLKVLEEPPKGVIFILCTTDPQKIPNTILSRVQRFDFKRIPTENIVSRLEYILEAEKIADLTVDREALMYIAKLADGGMRDAIMKLDTVLGYTNNITLEATLNCLGITSYEYLYKVTQCFSRQDCLGVIQLTQDIFTEGKDLKLFIKDLAKYVLDLCKYELSGDFKLTMIPADVQGKSKKLALELTLDLLVEILDKLNKLIDKVKYETNPKYMIESELMLLCRL